MFFKNATMFVFPKALDLDNLPSMLGEMPLKPVGPMELVSAGFIAPFGDGRLVVAGGALLISVGTESKVLPTSAIHLALKKKLDEMERVEGHKAGARTRKRVRGEIIAEMLPRALVKPGRTDALIYPAYGLIVVDTSSRAVAEMVVSHLRSALGSFPALPLNAEVSPRSVLTGWIAGEAMPAPLSLGEECELRDASDHGAVVKCQNQDLLSEEIEKHLAAGKQVSRLALNAGDHVSFVIGEDLTIRKIKFLEGATDTMDEADDMAGELAARLALGSAEIIELFGVLAKALKFSKAE